MRQNQVKTMFRVGVLDEHHRNTCLLECLVQAADRRCQIEDIIAALQEQGGRAVLADMRDGGEQVIYLGDFFSGAAQEVNQEVFIFGPIFVLIRIRMQIMTMKIMMTEPGRSLSVSSAV